MDFTRNFEEVFLNNLRLEIEKVIPVVTNCAMVELIYSLKIPSVIICDKLQITDQECHISKFSFKQCRQTRKICDEYIDRMFNKRFNVYS